jgi:hypothetical protein
MMMRGFLVCLNWIKQIKGLTGFYLHIRFFICTFAHLKSAHLRQFSKRFFNPSYGFNQFILCGGIRDPDRSRIAK